MDEFAKGEKEVIELNDEMAVDIDDDSPIGDLRAHLDLILITRRKVLRISLQLCVYYRLLLLVVLPLQRFTIRAESLSRAALNRVLTKMLAPRSLPHQKYSFISRSNDPLVFASLAACTLTIAVFAIGSKLHIARVTSVFSKTMTACTLSTYGSSTCTVVGASRIKLTTEF